MNFEEEITEKKDKGTALKAKMERAQLESSADEDEELAEFIAQLTQNLRQVMKMFNRSSNGGIPQHVPDNSQNTRNYNSIRKNTAVQASSYSKNIGSWIQCRECNGFGHIQSECAKTLKKSNKFNNATWKDGDSEGSREDNEHINNNVAFSTRLTTEKITGSSGSFDFPTGVPTDIPTLDSDSSDGEELTDEAIIESYKTIYQK